MSEGCGKPFTAPGVGLSSVCGEGASRCADCAHKHAWQFDPNTGQSTCECGATLAPEAASPPSDLLTALRREIRHIVREEVREALAEVQPGE